MKYKSPAIIILTVSLALGILAYLFMYKRDIGISVPIFTVLTLASILGFAWRSGMEMSLRRLWLIVPILCFAAMFFVRANLTILLADALAILFLTALMLNHLNGKHLDELGLFDYLGAIVVAGFMSAVGGFNIVAEVSDSVKSQTKTDKPASLVSIARGLFIAIPILLIFAVLLSSADPIFQDRLLSFTRWFDGDFSIADMIEFVVFAGVIGWLILGLTVFAMTETPIPQNRRDEEDIEKKSPRFISLNMTETGIVLGSVVLLFAFFVFIQFTYLFGQQQFFLENMTFADYARRGFFELVAVSVMTLGLILSLDRVTLRRAQSQQVIFRLASVLLVGLTLVMLASAWRRMSLYEEAYGFSHLRLYTHVFMVWLGILLLVGLLDIFRVRAHIFMLGALLVAIGYLGTLNIINVDAYIAEHNIARYQSGEDLDACYFYEFSSDAVPVIAEFYAGLEDADAKDKIGTWLYVMNTLENMRLADTNFLESNLSHHTAAEILGTFNLRDGERWSCYIDREN